MNLQDQELQETLDQLADDLNWEDDDDDVECLGHESLSGPIGNVVYCDGSCRK